MNRKITLFSLVSAVFIVVLMVFTSAALASYNRSTHTADHSAVVGSVHDMSRGIAGSNPCDSCHVPHGAKGTFLFSLPPNSSDGGTVSANDDAVASTAIKPLCYSCHDGTVTVNGTGLADAFSTAYSNHRTRSANAIDSNTGQPYGPGRDCDLCHDVHDDGNTSFLKYEYYTTHFNPSGEWLAIAPGGDVCASCHKSNVDVSQGGTSMNHATEVVPGATALSHTPLDTRWLPVIGDYSGTRLFDPTTHRKSSAATAVVECESCHTPHGGTPSALGGTAPNQYHALNTMIVGPDPANPALPYLCINCH